MINTKFVDLMKIRNFVFWNFLHILFILAGKLNFLFLQKRFWWIKLEPLVKNGCLTNWLFLRLFFIFEIFGTKKLLLLLWHPVPKVEELEFGPWMEHYWAMCHFYHGKSFWKWGNQSSAQNRSIAVPKTSVGGIIIPATE